MSDTAEGRSIPSDDPVAIELLLAVRGGDVDAVNRLLRDDPELAATRFVGKDGGSGTALRHDVRGMPLLEGSCRRSNAKELRKKPIDD